MTWPLLGFLIYIGLLALLTGWFIDASQRALDRHLDERDDAAKMREALKKLPP